MVVYVIIHIKETLNYNIWIKNVGENALSLVNIDLVEQEQVILSNASIIFMGLKFKILLSSDWLKDIEKYII
jgi:hypothetical protein